MKLKNLRILNTRPEDQAQDLNIKITAAGGKVISCPALAIEEIDGSWIKRLPPLEKIHYAIFTSTNAVKYTFNKLNLQWLPSIKVIAIGSKTAETLTKYGINISAEPQISDSEHLLQLPEMQLIANKSIILFTGQNGRMLIPNTINQRGAILYIMEVYKRIMPDYNELNLRSLWKNDGVDIILFTSEQAIQQLIIMFGKSAKIWLCNKVCIVISARLAQAASTNGFKHIIVSDHKKLFETICDYNKGLIHDR